MSLPQTLAPKPRAVTINGQQYNLVAFYYPDKDTAWDLLYQAQFLANFYPCNFTLTINNITGTFQNSEAAFQATKWWNTSDRKKFEGITGSQAYSVKTNLKNPDYSYAGLGQLGAMKTVLIEKFSDPKLQQGLLLTGDAYLLEHNAVKGRDKGGWSDDHDGLGQHAQNLLGLTLMEVREHYKGLGAPAGSYSITDFTNSVETKSTTS